MKNYYKIHEISKLYNIGVDSLRYYEEIGILHPTRDQNNYRQYTTSDIYRLNMIRDLRGLGLSMKHIAAYLEHRTIENTLSFMNQEEAIIDEKIKSLQGLKKDIQKRKDALQKSYEITFDDIKKLHFDKRRCVRLATSPIQSDIEYQLIKLSKEYEENIFAIANFHTGCFIDINDVQNPHPNSVFIIGDTLSTYEFLLPEGDYLTLWYQGERDHHYEHLQEMIAYCKKHHYEILGEAMEFYIIDVHETTIKDEYITELQLHIKTN